MQSQCPQCYSSEIVIAKPKSISIWIVPMVLVDATILAVAFSGMVENPAPLIVGLVVADLLLTIPLMRAFLARNQAQSSVTYHCTACGHTWVESSEAPISAETRRVETPPVGVSTADFQMIVEDVFSIKGRGTVITGVVESGAVGSGATIEIHSAGGVTQTTVDAIEMFRKATAQANAGDNVGLLLRSVGKDEVRRGDVLRGMG